MKVIKQGTNPATTPVQAVCSNCSAQIEFLPNEAKMNYDQRDGNFYSLSCPCCGHLITKDAHSGYWGPG